MCKYVLYTYNELHVRDVQMHANVHTYTIEYGPKLRMISILIASVSVLPCSQNRNKQTMTIAIL